MTLLFNDPRFSRLIQRLVDERVARMLAKQVPERHYGQVVLVDEDEREATVRQQQGSVTVDTPHVHFGSFTPEVGQRVGYTQWRRTGDVYIDAAVDPVTPSAASAEAVAALALDRIRLASVTTETILSDSSVLLGVTWDTPFADDQYLTFATIEEGNSATVSTGLSCQATSHTADAVQMRVSNTTTEDRTPTLMVLGLHL